MIRTQVELAVEEKAESRSPRAPDEAVVSGNHSRKSRVRPPVRILDRVVRCLVVHVVRTKVVPEDLLPRGRPWVSTLEVAASESGVNIAEQDRHVLQSRQAVLNPVGC